MNVVFIRSRDINGGWNIMEIVVVSRCIIGAWHRILLDAVSLALATASLECCTQGKFDWWESCLVIDGTYSTGLPRI